MCKASWRTGRASAGLPPFSNARPRFAWHTPLDSPDLRRLAKHGSGLSPALALHQEEAKRVGTDLRWPFVFNLFAEVFNRPIEIPGQGTLVGATNAWIEDAEELEWRTRECRQKGKGRQSERKTRFGTSAQEVDSDPRFSARIARRSNQSCRSGGATARTAWPVGGVPVDSPWSFPTTIAAPSRRTKKWWLRPEAATDGTSHFTSHACELRLSQPAYPRVNSATCAAKTRFDQLRRDTAEGASLRRDLWAHRDARRQ